MRYLVIAAATLAVLAVLWFTLYRSSRVGRSTPPPPVGGPARAVVSRGRHAAGDLRIDPTVEITPGLVQRALGGAR